MCRAFQAANPETPPTIGMPRPVVEQGFVSTAVTVWDLGIGVLTQANTETDSKAVRAAGTVGFLSEERS